MNNPYFIFEITDDCNHNCCYCYNIWKNNKIHKTQYKTKLALKKNYTLDFKNIKVLFDKIMGNVEVEGLTFAGGEPLLHPDIFKSAEYLHSMNVFKLGVATNGTLLYSENIKKLIDSGIKYFEISMPSLNKTIYKTLTSNGNFDILKKNILELRKYDVYICISAVITKINIKGITELFEFCRACSINSLALNRLCYSGSAIKNFKNLNPEYYELKNLFNLLNTLNSGDSSMPVRFTIPFENCIYKCNELSNLEFSRCRCGIDKWVIDSAGNLRICEQSEEILGSLLKKDFIELSNSENVKNLLNKTKFPECSLCSDFTICRSGCKYVLI